MIHHSTVVLKTEGCIKKQSVCCQGSHEAALLKHVFYNLLMTAGFGLLYKDSACTHLTGVQLARTEHLVAVG